MAPRSKKEGYIDWHNSKARGIVMGDLEPGGTLKGLDYVEAKVVFEFYKQMPDFADVVLGHFKERLADHWKEAGKDHAQAKRDQEAYEKDRLVCPCPDWNKQGELVFDLHPAKHFLRQDVANRLYKEIAQESSKKAVLPTWLLNTRCSNTEFTRRFNIKSSLTIGQSTQE
ncbi:hypothetical protein ACA910_011498 [Epithemia clementina (nom. ined.)]